MKIKVRLTYPVSSLHQSIEEIDVPDYIGDKEGWIYNRTEEILKDAGADDDAVVYAMEFLDDMGITILKGGENE